ncbi:hypothetical protein HYC85_025526 [Camellia sinensis]|uniref:Uncharacterized protein n=1 Tax=Camellia sinensis TaxID=4442 RepID=A0A7J7GBA0_CAMSI|nr:hypothetical protein HYC85_025526 [Camellia sinensis]
MLVVPSLLLSCHGLQSYKCVHMYGDKMEETLVRENKKGEKGKREGHGGRGRREGTVIIGCGQQ